MGERGLLEKKGSWEKGIGSCIVRRNLEKREGRLGQETKGDLEEESEGSTSEFL